MKYLQDDNGNQSTMRAVWILAVVLILGTWSYVCISTGKLHNFQVGDAVFFGMLIAGKVGQKYLERNEAKNNNNPS